MWVTFFQDRKEAGQKLASALSHYKKQKEGIVIGLPRGGVVTAYEVAQALQLPLDIVIPRKIGAPFNPELAIGAICDDETILNKGLIEDLNISSEYIEKEIEKAKKEAERRYQLYCREKRASLENKIVIIVDDGIATGATMEAAIASIKKRKAQKIVVAVPVAPPETIDKINLLVDEVISLHTPAYFASVGMFYTSFDQTQDAEIINLLTKGKQ